MREALCIALAEFRDQPLTLEVGKELVAKLFPERAIDPLRFSPEVTGDYVLRVESFRTIMDELAPLHEAHFAETERARAGLALMPDLQYRAEKERAGQMLQFTARILSTRELVGNLRMFLYNDTHTGALCAEEDALFLMPHVRMGMLAVNFLRFAERALASIGVVDAFADTKILYDEESKVVRDVGKLMQFMRWRHVSNRYMKRLSEPEGASK